MPIVIDYFLWHYTTALKEGLHVWSNLVWFVVRLFSIPQLLGSLFAPFRRMTEERRKKWDIEDMMSTLVINTISRILGAILRLTFIIIGVLALIGLLIGIVIFLVTWVLAPALVVMSTGYGIFLLF